MEKTPLRLDEWERWIGELKHPCAFVHVTAGTIDRVVLSGGFRGVPGELAPGAPFPAAPSGGTLFRHYPFPFLGEDWHWTAPEAESDALSGAFRLFLDRVPLPFFVLDDRGRIVMANDRCRAIAPPPGPGEPPPGESWSAQFARAAAGDLVDVETDTLFQRRLGRTFRLVLVPVAPQGGPAPRLVLGTFWDITETHRNLEALRESEARFRILFEKSPEGLLTLSADGFLLQANRTTCATVGLSVEKLRSRHLLSLFPEEEREPLAAALKRCASSGATVRTDLRYHHPEDGSLLHLSLVVSALEGMGAERFLVVLQDRTRLKLLETHAQLSERRYEKLFQASPDAIFTCLADGTLLAFNHQAGVLFGWSPPAVTGRKIGLEVGVVPRPLVDGWIAHVVRRGHGGAADTLRTTCSFDDVTGLRRTFTVHALPYQDDTGRAIGLSVHLHDETENRLLQERLADSKEHFRSLVENSSDIIFQLTPEWRVVYVNPAVEELLGIPPRDILGRPLRPRRFLAPEQLDRLRRRGADTLRREGLHAELVRLTRRDGTAFWAQLSLVPIVQESRLRAMLGIIRDVDDLYQAQQQLEHQAQKLRQTVFQLEEAGRLQEQFVANVTHELRTPLTTILVTSEVLERDLGDAASATRRHQIELIRNNARTLHDLINDLLDLAKLKHDKFQPRDREFQLAGLVRQLKDMVDPLFAQKGLAFEIRVSPEAPVAMYTDEEMLRKILSNLLSNAYKFTDRGRVTFEVDRSGPNLVFRVTDTGMGICEKDIARIFEEFRQLDSSDARRYPGTGLGLSIADRMASLLGGRIDVTSAEGRGSVFALVLPLARAAAPVRP